MCLKKTVMGSHMLSKLEISTLSRILAVKILKNNLDISVVKNQEALSELCETQENCNYIKNLPPLKKGKKKGPKIYSSIEDIEKAIQYNKSLPDLNDFEIGGDDFSFFSNLITFDYSYIKRTNPSLEKWKLIIVEIKSALTYYNISKGKAAEMAGIKENDISEILSLRQKPSIDLVRKLAELSNLDLDLDLSNYE